MTIFFRLLTTEIDAKGTRLAEQVDTVNAGQGAGDIFTAEPAGFEIMPESPFAYWLSGELLHKLQSHPTFEPEAAVVRQGLATSDDPRFVRAIWEVNPADLYFCYYPSDGSLTCNFNDPIVSSFFVRRHKGRMKWAFHVKAGTSQPWYSPLTLVVNWEEDGRLLKEFIRSQGHSPSKRVQSESHYFRPGFSWTLRAVRLVPYIVPANAISTVSRYMAFPNRGLEFNTLAFAASNLASGLARIYGEKFEWPKFLVETVKRLPWAQRFTDVGEQFTHAVLREVQKRRNAYGFHEPFQEFCYAWRAISWSGYDASALEFDSESLLGRELEKRVAELYNLEDIELADVEFDLLEAIWVRKHGRATSVGEDINSDQDSYADNDRELAVHSSPQLEINDLLQYTLGCAYGRWDLRLAQDSSLLPKPAGPFDPLPVCPPGTLVGTDGLPARPGGIVSEEWLRARPNAITLPPDGTVQQSTIKDNEYPLRVDWDGIMTDDEQHPDDIVRRVRDVLDLLYKERCEAIEQEACQILGVESLREYFRQPRNFFDFHIKRYSKSRRKAPIYWLLQSSKRNYGLWIYYHRIDSDTLFKALTQYADPKLNLENIKLNDLRGQLQSDMPAQARRALDKAIAKQELLISELVDFRNELDQVARLQLAPDLNDGVLISIAPLHKLVPWKEAGKMWDELVQGKYEWSSMSTQMRQRKLVK